MLQKYPLRAYARITLECQSPLVIATGQSQGGYDNQILRDANDLPYIPGATLAGVLRHLWKKARGESEQDSRSPFGYQQPRGDEGLPSAIRFTPALLVLGSGSVLEGLALPDEKDPVINWLKASQPLMRDRVRINHRGAAADTGKYDVVAVPKGTRFRFELCWEGTENETFDDFRELLGLLNGGAFRLGANTRSGYGRVKPVLISVRQYDLRNPSDIGAYLKRNRSLALAQVADDAKAFQAKPLQPGQIVDVALDVKSRSPFRIGGGGKAFYRVSAANKNASENARIADALLYSEPTITWARGDNRGEWREHSLVIPGSSIKGALRHRFEFHLRRHLRCFAGQTGSQEQFETTVAWLFGSEDVRHLNGMDSDGLAGVVYVDDIYLDPAGLGQNKIGMRIHNSIDRFTGGTLEGALYSEEYLHEAVLKIQIQLDLSRLDKLSQEWTNALMDTLDDFCSGALPLGAGGGKGMGHFAGKHSFHPDVITGALAANKNKEDVA